jgi:hypothetical protein
LEIVLPFLLPQGFVPVVSFIKIRVMNDLIPFLRGSIGPQEKEPPDSLF